MWLGGFLCHACILQYNFCHLIFAGLPNKASLAGWPKARREAGRRQFGTVSVVPVAFVSSSSSEVDSGLKELADLEFLAPVLTDITAGGVT